MKMKKMCGALMAIVMSMGMVACGNQATEVTDANSAAEYVTVSSVSEASSEVSVEDASTEASSGAQAEEITVTDMIGREVTVVPGSYKKVVCIGAGALRMYSYIGDVATS